VNVGKGPAEAGRYRCLVPTHLPHLPHYRYPPTRPTGPTGPTGPTYQTRHAVERTIGASALHLNAPANSGMFETTPLTR
jgi:hypothetical protein